MATDAAAVTHKGACHCGAVQFEVDAPSDVVAWDCDCSICAMRRNVHFIVPADSLRFVKGEDAMTT